MSSAGQPQTFSQLMFTPTFTLLRGVPACAMTLFTLLITERHATGW